MGRSLLCTLYYRSLPRSRCGQRVKGLFSWWSRGQHGKYATKRSRVKTHIKNSRGGAAELPRSQANFYLIDWHSLRSIRKKTAWNPGRDFSILTLGRPCIQLEKKQLSSSLGTRPRRNSGLVPRLAPLLLSGQEVKRLMFSSQGVKRLIFSSQGLSG